MIKLAALAVLSVGVAFPALARPARIPESSINCAQFVKTGPTTWTEVGTAQLTMRGARMELSDYPITPKLALINGASLYIFVDKTCTGNNPRANTKADSSFTGGM